jgi:hypothetical protein
MYFSRPLSHRLEVIVLRWHVGNLLDPPALRGLYVHLRYEEARECGSFFSWGAEAVWGEGRHRRKF